MGRIRNATLIATLKLKARRGHWDSRFLAYYKVPNVHNSHVRAFIMRGFASGLVVTATTNGHHAANSLHYQARAADLGLRGPEVGTARGLRKMIRFQKREFARRSRYHHTELIGPTNNRIILRGHATTLAEHTALEDAHDNHVHGAF